MLKSVEKFFMYPFNKLTDWLTDIGVLPTYYVVEIMRVGTDKIIIGMGPYNNKDKADRFNDVLSPLLKENGVYTRIRKLDNY